MKQRMREYITNGCHLAWLLDLNNEKVYIYKMDGSEAVIDNFDNTIMGEKILRGYSLNLSIL
jgi:hypothetical protein